MVIVRAFGSGACRQHIRSCNLAHSPKLLAEIDSDPDGSERSAV